MYVTKKPKKINNFTVWQTSYSSRPPTSSYRDTVLRSRWSSDDSSKFRVSSKWAERLPRCEGSKSGLLHYFGQWPIQQPVRPYGRDKIQIYHLVAKLLCPVCVNVHESRSSRFVPWINYKCDVGVSKESGCVLLIQCGCRRREAASETTTISVAGQAGRAPAASTGQRRHD